MRRKSHYTPPIREADVLYILLILTVGLANFAIGFALAMHFGHGPAWEELLKQIRPEAAAQSPAKAAPAKAKTH